MTKLSLPITSQVRQPVAIFVGSTNPVKVNAVKQAVIKHWPDLAVTGFEVNSQIPAQPIGDDQTRLGAQNRARLALEFGLALESSLTDTTKHNQSTYLGIGLEGGVVEYDGQLWSTVWGCVTDGSLIDNQPKTLPTQLRFFEANGARFILPEKIAQAIRDGEELGPLMSRLHDGADVKRTSGAIGILTDNFVDRTEEYSAIIKLAVGLWHGRINGL